MLKIFKKHFHNIILDGFKFCLYAKNDEKIADLIASKGVANTFANIDWMSSTTEKQKGYKRITFKKLIEII